MRRRKHIGQRLARAFVLQIGFIGLAAGAGVYAAKILLEGNLINQALRDEAAHFRNLQSLDPNAALPDTHNLKGYLRSPQQRTADLPADLRDLPPGFHELRRESGFLAAFVDHRPESDLILVFDGKRVEELAVLFGIAPLAGVLTLIYLFTWFAYRSSTKAISPVVQLAQRVADINLENPDALLPEFEQLGANGDREVHALADALSRLTDRVRRFVDRERTFTREASHELRSPTTVVKMAADLLLTDPGLAPDARAKVLRIKRAARDMEDLIAAFLLLARESEQGLPETALCVNEVAVEQLELARPLLQGKNVTLSMVAPGRLFLKAPLQVVAVLTGNLIRNACTYTERGHVRIHVGPQGIQVEDSGIGIAEHELHQIFQPFYRISDRPGGHGVGLTIVRRLADRFGWPLSISSEPGSGTVVCVSFPDARWEPSETGEDSGEPAGSRGSLPPLDPRRPT